MSNASDHSIYERLGNLTKYATLPAFAQAFYELIADYMLASDTVRGDLPRLFLEYLGIEERYHASLSSLAAGDTMALRGVRDATEKREIGMRSLLELLDRERTYGRAEVARLLLSAECCYHLGLTDRVVAQLEVAVGLGAEHPLVQFALGYNRFQLANQAFTAADPDSGEVRVLDEDRYRLACLTAVNAFQAGLRGEPFDGQLHWWIGNVLQAAGFKDAAAASRRRAAEVIGAGFEWGHDADLIEMEEALPGESDEELGPITAAELAAAAALLRRPYLRSELN